MDDFRGAADLVRKSRHVVVLTGAGISVESGIPDFRSKDGLWSKFDPAEYATIQSFRANPAKIWRMLLEMDSLLAHAMPNAAHYTLAEMERRGIVKEIVTQNIDSLHQKAGSRNVTEFHGHARTLRCDRCRLQYDREEVSLESLPPLCSCGNALRPEIVFFGEDIPADAYRRASMAAGKCDLLMIVGTSATVAPASYLPQLAKGSGAALLEINPTESELTYRMTDMYIAQPAGKALPALLEALDVANR